MTYGDRFVVEPGTAVRLADIDPDYAGKLGRERSEHKTRKAIRRLRQLQYLLYANAKNSLLIVLQGPDASGKDGLIRHVFGGLNPQGIAVAAFGQPTELEAEHDFLWRVHRRVPAKGQIVVFNRSHYEDVLVPRVRQLVPKSVWGPRYAMINAFEELLWQGGTRILKFYLHIDPKEQLDRFRRRLEDETRQWKIKESDYSDRNLWDQFSDAHEAMLRQTSTNHAPWYVIPSNRKWFRNLAVARIMLETIRDMKLKSPPPSVDIDDIRRKYHDAEDDHTNNDRLRWASGGSM